MRASEVCASRTLGLAHGHCQARDSAGPTDGAAGFELSR